MPESFGFVANIDAETLILGSMPGVESLRKNEYYAFRHNVFWRIMGGWLSFSPELAYHERLECLKRARIALWDVLSRCERSGSLDSGISSELPNDIYGFLETHKNVRRIFCNGSASYNFFKKYFPDIVQKYNVTRLPSTSPAAVSISFEEKFKAYGVIFIAPANKKKQWRSIIKYTPPCL